MNAFIAIDWGTTNRRAYRIEDGAVTATTRDDRGILSIAPGGFDAEVAALRAAHGGLPMLMAGMIGSNRGWHDAGYVAAPATLEQLAAGLVRPAADIAIVPGVCRTGERHDVMRGEEVQLLGAVAAGLAPADALLCQPGTHCKWARMAGGGIADFTTAMTGEVHAILKAHSLIGAEMAGEARIDDDFRAGVRDGAGGDLLARLFGVRAASVLGARAAGGAASYVSGLLIGSDCAPRLTRHGSRDGGPVHILADGFMADAYAAAITELGGSAIAVDSHESFIAGITRIRDMTR